MRRLLLTLALLGLVLLLLPGAALAHNDGRGFYGATNDKVVTNAGFILIIFFPLFVFSMSMLQRKLDKRKAARKEARQAQLGESQWRGGW
jgi:preprotein translocase subunit SecG